MHTATIGTTGLGDNTILQPRSMVIVGRYSWPREEDHGDEVGKMSPTASTNSDTVLENVLRSFQLHSMSKVLGKKIDNSKIKTTVKTLMQLVVR